MLRGKTAIITGASRGIGRAIAEAYAGHGASVCLVSRTKETLDQTTALLQSRHGQKVIGYCSDITDRDTMRQVFQATETTFGSVDIVVANAGINTPTGRLAELDTDAWFAMFRTNVLGLAITCKLATEFMKAKGGNIITLGSGIGHRGAASNSAYAASKAASWSLTRSLALELAALNIAVNELIPGPVITDMNPGASGPNWKQPEQVAPLALFLASQTSGGPTGQSFSLMRQ